MTLCKYVAFSFYFRYGSGGNACGAVFVFKARQDTAEVSRGVVVELRVTWKELDLKSNAWEEEKFPRLLNKSGRAEPAFCTDLGVPDKGGKSASRSTGLRQISCASTLFLTPGKGGKPVSRSAGLRQVSCVEISCNGALLADPGRCAVPSATRLQSIHGSSPRCSQYCESFPRSVLAPLSERKNAAHVTMTMPFRARVSITFMRFSDFKNPGCVVRTTETKT